jgi:hypothetical protein
MDPLSVTASIIAVVTAAGQISKGLRSLYDLRHAPQEVIELANEVPLTLRIQFICTSLIISLGQ